MTAISSTLNVPVFSTDALAGIGEKIFKNETGGDKTKLVFWSEKEPEWASMGAFHNLWLIKGCTATYLEDSFTIFLQKCKQQNIELPEWLQENQTCPWENREAFLKEDPQKIEQLRTFLWTHRGAQTEFVMANFHKTFPKVIEALPEFIRPDGIKYCNLLFSMPEGSFALIDYVNFKGPGIGQKYPQYYRDDPDNDPVCLSAQLGCMNNENECTIRGWGLVQVLTLALNQSWNEEPIEAFITSAKTVLMHRVLHAHDKGKNEQSFTAGWNNRLDRYREKILI